MQTSVAYDRLILSGRIQTVRSTERLGNKCDEHGQISKKREEHGQISKKCEERRHISKNHEEHGQII